MYHIVIQHYTHCELISTSPVTIPHHTKLLQYWVYFVCCVFHLSDLFIFITGGLIFFTCLTQPLPPLPSGNHQSIHIYEFVLVLLCLADSTCAWNHMVLVFIWFISLNIIGLRPSMLLKMAKFYSFSWPSNIPLYICTTLQYPLVCWWVFTLFPFLGNNKQGCSEHWGAYIFLN